MWNNCGSKILGKTSTQTINFVGSMLVFGGALVLLVPIQKSC